MSDILLFAAGSLRLAFAPLLSAFQRDTGQKVSAEFGPAGLLRQRIENGERPQLFASANVAHPQRLADLGIAGAVQILRTIGYAPRCATCGINRASAT